MSSPLARALAQFIDTHGGSEGVLPTSFAGLALFRATDTVSPSHTLYKPCLCLASQFSREYARMFGDAPKRDASGLKGARA
jgi:hypothetical protein